MIPVSGLVGFWAWMQLTIKFRWENPQLLLEMMFYIIAWNSVISILESMLNMTHFDKAHLSLSWTAARGVTYLINQVGGESNGHCL
jgi:hypothetical protein